MSIGETLCFNLYSKLIAQKSVENRQWRQNMAELNKAIKKIEFNTAEPEPSGLGL